MCVEGTSDKKYRRIVDEGAPRAEIHRGQCHIRSDSLRQRGLASVLQFRGPEAGHPARQSSTARLRDWSLNPVVAQRISD
jgi:hypothetical protein